MTTDTFYIIRCQRRTRKGGAGFVVAARFEDGQFVVRKQTTEQHERLWEGDFGRINPSLPHKTVYLPQTQGQTLLDELNQLSAPLLPPIGGGFGGTDYTLTIHHADNMVQFRWWLDCPEEWQSIETAWRAVTSLVDE